MDKKPVILAAKNALLKLKNLAKREKDVRNSLIAEVKQRILSDEEKEKARIAAKNVLEDLQVEKDALAHAKALDEAILASISDGIIAIDSDRKIIIMNKAAEDLLSCDSKETIGVCYDSVISLENKDGIPIPLKGRPLAQVFSQDYSSSKTTILYLLNKNKIKFPVAITVSPIILGGKILGAVEVIRDITKEMEIDKAKNDFVSITSHQLRTPLTGIQWLTELLEKEKLTDKGKEYIDDIKKSVQRLNALVELLLNISRIEEGQVKIYPESIDVVGFVRKMLHNLSPLYNKKKLSLILTSNKSKIIALTDIGALQNIAQAILSNAIEYTPEAGTIKVELKKNTQTFLLSVSDTGIGIPKKDQKFIFQKFARASNADNLKAGGMGMGLWIAKRATEFLGGKIWFKSPSALAVNSREKDEPVQNVLDEGTTFFVELPLKTIAIKGTKRLV